MGFKLLLGALLTLLALRWVPTDDPWVQRHVVESALSQISDNLPEITNKDSIVVGLSEESQTTCPWLGNVLKSQKIEIKGATPKVITFSIGSIRDSQIHASCASSTSWGSMGIVFKGNPANDAWKDLQATANVPSWIALVAPVLAVVWAFLLGNAFAGGKPVARMSN